LSLLSGCASLSEWNLTPWKRDASAAADAPKDNFVLRGNGLEKDQALASPQREELDGGKRLLETSQHEKAEAVFEKLAKDKKCPEQIREEAIFLQAESQRLQKHYRQSEITYLNLFKDFPNTQYTERADKGLFEIALHWLEGTRDQMKEYEEQREGQRWFVRPASFVHFSSDMPFMDTEGSAIRVLEHIRMHEINTPLGEQALIYLGTIKFFREDYHDADHYFSELYTRYPNSKHAAKAIKQAIICKQLCTGGTVYDCRSIEESKKLIHTAQTAYADFAKEDEWIHKQLVSINMQQADRDFKVAEFYKRTGHPGSAYFYYEIVRRTYPNTEYASKSAERMAELEQHNGSALRPSATNPQEAMQTTPANPAQETPAAAPRMLPPSLSPPRP
jgi:outer membrane protein assembly factor BamD (BamD/ComL family)